VPAQMAIFAGGCPPATSEPQCWAPASIVDFRNRLETNRKKIIYERNPTSQPSIRYRRKSRIFSRKVATLRGCRDSNLWPLPHAKPPLLLHHTLICIHMQFWFYSYYTT
jgi:hypothetical protein